MIPEIMAAIAERKQISFTYNDAVRVVNPHVYGTDKNSKWRLRGTQQASNGVAHTADWKLFDEAKITDVKLLDTALVQDPLLKETDSVIVNALLKLQVGN